MERAAGWPPLAVFHESYVTTAVLGESRAKNLISSRLKSRLRRSGGNVDTTSATDAFISGSGTEICRAGGRESVSLLSPIRPVVHPSRFQE